MNRHPRDGDSRRQGPCVYGYYKQNCQCLNALQILVKLYIVLKDAKETTINRGMFMDHFQIVCLVRRYLDIP